VLSLDQAVALLAAEARAPDLAQLSQ